MGFYLSPEIHILSSAHVEKTCAARQNQFFPKKSSSDIPIDSTVFHNYGTPELLS